ncbi:hypothetical protein D3C71_1527680 [compost metagenome]
MFGVIAKNQNMILFNTRLQALPECGASVREIIVGIQQVSYRVMQALSARILGRVNQAILAVPRMLNNR